MSSELVWLGEGATGNNDDRHARAELIRACKATVLVQPRGAQVSADALGEAAYALRLRRPVLFAPEVAEDALDSSWWMMASCHMCPEINRAHAAKLALAIAEHGLEERFVALSEDTVSLLELHESPIELRLGLHLVNRCMLLASVRSQRELTIGGRKYRADFTISDDEKGLHVVVECDGHDFHERTKEQAARDKARDRAMVAEGYSVLRFTGSEIWKDPARCASEALAVARTKLEIGS